MTMGANTRYSDPSASRPVAYRSRDSSSLRSEDALLFGSAQRGAGTTIDCPGGMADGEPGNHGHASQLAPVRFLGWATALLMTAAAVGMFATV
jgi:hypothetical protein